MAIERFNTGIVADAGHRGTMEDMFVVCQDLGIDPYVKISVFAVIDGHGGDFCADFLRQRMTAELKKELSDPEKGLLATQSVNESIT